MGGFSVDEIARAFLLRPATVAQRLVRAQRLLRERRVAFELPATLADLWLRCGERQAAAAHYRRALELSCSEPERRFLLRRLAACEPCS